MEQKMSQKFYIREDRRTNEGYSIIQRVIIERAKSERVTGEYVKSPSKWDPQTGRPKRNNELSDTLDDLATKTRQVFRELKSIYSNVTAKMVIAALNGKNQKFGTFSDIWRHYLEIRNNDYHTSKDLVSRLKTTLALFERFQEEKGGELRPKAIGRSVVDEFESFLSRQISPWSKQPFSVNNVHKHMKRFKQVCTFAVESNFMDKHPFGTKRLKRVKKKREFLTQAELDNVENLDLTDEPCLDRVRDIFRFTVYTGLRFSDAINLSVDDITFDQNGDAFLTRNLNQSIENGEKPKSNDRYIMAQAVEIIKKYSKESEASGKVLPRYSNQKVNTYLKVIADLAGIKKRLTHHVARHTFATTILAANGIQLEAIKELMGHKNIQQTVDYTRVNWPKVWKQLREIGSQSISSRTTDELMEERKRVLKYLRLIDSELDNRDDNGVAA